MAVPALSDELATSRLTTTLAKGVTRSNCQSFRMRVTKLREALGAVGCAASRSRSTTATARRAPDCAKCLPEFCHPHPEGLAVGPGHPLRKRGGQPARGQLVTQCWHSH